MHPAKDGSYYFDFLNRLFAASAARLPTITMVAGSGTGLTATWKKRVSCTAPGVQINRALAGSVPKFDHGLVPFGPRSVIEVVAPPNPIKLAVQFESLALTIDWVLSLNANPASLRDRAAASIEGAPKTSRAEMLI